MEAAQRAEPVDGSRLRRRLARVRNERLAFDDLDGDSNGESTCKAGASARRSPTISHRSGERARVLAGR